MLDQGGATFLMQGFACSHLSSFGPADEPHLDEARSAWLACGGAEPGEDSYVMGYSHERPSLLVPRSVLRALWEELDRLERAT